MMNARLVTHIDGVPVRHPFYTYAAVTMHRVPGWRARLSSWLRRLSRRFEAAPQPEIES